jgi:S-adenosylmethionine synthetase
VSEGHPDKVCDRISDTILDAYLAKMPEARSGIETLATTNRVVIAGEVRGPASIDNDRIVDLARGAIRDIGYEQDGFHWQTADIAVYLHAQSADIAQGVDASGNKDEGAGDQGMMFGFACDETPDLMPAPIFYAHKILEDLARARKGKVNGAGALGPDAKSQVTVRYAGGKPIGVTQIVLSTQHFDEALTSDDIRAIVEPYIRKTLPEGWITNETVWHVNPTGKFVIGGPDGDCGLTGRKIIVDTYGGAAPTRPRSTALPPMRPATSPRTWWRPGSHAAARSRSPMPSASPSPCRSTPTSTIPARSPRSGSRPC